jgi:CBS domain containing-hemolysin-like protein
MAKVAQNILNNLDSYLSATQLGITLASLGLGWIGEPVVSKILIAVFHAMGLNVPDETAHQIALPVAFALITVLHIVFGELAPKSIAIRKPEETTLFVSWPMRAFFPHVPPLHLGAQWFGQSYSEAGGHTTCRRTRSP